MTDNTQELDVILNEVTSFDVYKHPEYIEEAKQAILDWHTRKLNEAIREEWALISEVAHSANITAELFIGKARKDRLAELDTINAGESNENIRLTQVKLRKTY